MRLPRAWRSGDQRDAIRQAGRPEPGQVAEGKRSAFRRLPGLARRGKGLVHSGRLRILGRRGCQLSAFHHRSTVFAAFLIWRKWLTPPPAHSRWERDGVGFWFPRRRPVQLKRYHVLIGSGLQPSRQLNPATKSSLPPPPPWVRSATLTCKISGVRQGLRKAGAPAAPALSVIETAVASWSVILPLALIRSHVERGPLYGRTPYLDRRTSPARA